MKPTHFERAIFLSWYCSKGDCKFCYMSTQKDKIKDPKLAKRRISSILAEAIICKECGWEIEFLSGGYESFDTDELLQILKHIKNITKRKQWLNIGVIKESDIIKFKPYIQGITGAIECINPKLQKKLCPSKPIKEITDLFKLCDRHNLKKSMTIVIGLGEKIEDHKFLTTFIKKYKIDRITFYALNPHQGTEFKTGPKTSYYKQWLEKTRDEFPKLEIIAGSWVDRLKEIHYLLDAGADSITKFPSIKLFNTKFAKQIETGCRKAKRTFKGTMTKLPKINIDKELKKHRLPKDLEIGIKIKLNQYLKTMAKKQ